MQIEADRFDELIERMRQISVADRKAVLGRLPLDQRYAIEQKLQSRRKPDADGQRSSAVQKYRMFSPTLAAMVAEIEKNGEPVGSNGEPLTAATCAALLESAEALRNELQKNAADNDLGLWSMFKKALFPEGSR